MLTKYRDIDIQRKRHKDWFDENDFAARKTLDDMYAKHLAWINDKSSASKKAAYIQTRIAAQQRSRQIKENWWTIKAKELQEAAD